MDAQPTAPKEPILEMIARLRAICEYERAYNLKGFALFYALLNSKRLYTTGDTDGVQRLWDQIRNNVELTDFVIQVTRELFLRCSDLPGTDIGPERYLAQRLAGSLDCLGMEDSAIDSDTLEQMHLGPTLLDMYQNNPWYSMLTLADMCRLRELVPADAQPAATQSDGSTPPGAE